MLRATGVASVTSFSSARGVYSGATRDASPGRAQAGSRRMLFTITSTALRSVPTPWVTDSSGRVICVAIQPEELAWKR